MTYTLIIPIYNEDRTLPALLKKLDRLDDKIEIIINVELTPIEIKSKKLK